MPPQCNVLIYPTLQVRRLGICSFPLLPIPSVQCTLPTLPTLPTLQVCGLVFPRCCLLQHLRRSAAHHHHVNERLHNHQGSHPGLVDLGEGDGDLDLGEGGI